MMKGASNKIGLDDDDDAMMISSDDEQDDEPQADDGKDSEGDDEGEDEDEEEEEEEEEDADDDDEEPFTLSFHFHQNSKTNKGSFLDDPITIINNHSSDRWPDKLCDCLKKHCPMKGAYQVLIANMIEDARQFVNAHHPTPESFKEFLKNYLKGEAIVLITIY
jgi:hypothetical protein